MLSLRPASGSRARRYDAVVDAVAGTRTSLTVGDPIDPATTIGPLVAERQLDGSSRLHRHRAEAKVPGGRRGGRPEGLERGWYVGPTIFVDVDNNDADRQEEIFGPVLAVIPYATRRGGGDRQRQRLRPRRPVWTADERGASRSPGRSARATIGVNGYVNDPFAPFGGVKSSGMGRELGPEGLQPFQLLKTIYLDEANDPA